MWRKIRCVDIEGPQCCDLQSIAGQLLTQLSIEFDLMNFVDLEAYVVDLGIDAELMKMAADCDVDCESI